MGTESVWEITYKKWLCVLFQEHLFHRFLAQSSTLLIELISDNGVSIEPGIS